MDLGAIGRHVCPHMHASLRPEGVFSLTGASCAPCPPISTLLPRPLVSPQSPVSRGSSSVSWGFGLLRARQTGVSPLRSPKSPRLFFMWPSCRAMTCTVPFAATTTLPPPCRPSRGVPKVLLVLLLLACHTVGVARACSRDVDSGLRRFAPSVLVGGAPYASCRVAPGAAPLGPLWPPAGSAVRHGSCGDACLALGASAPATLSSAGGFCRGKQRLFGAGLGPPGGSTTSHVESSWDLVGQNVDSRLLVSGVNRDVSAAKAVLACGPARGNRVQSLPPSTWHIGQVGGECYVSQIGVSVGSTGFDGMGSSLRLGDPGQGCCDVVGCSVGGCPHDGVGGLANHVDASLGAGCGPPGDGG